VKQRRPGEISRIKNTVELQLGQGFLAEASASADQATQVWVEFVIEFLKPYLKVFLVKVWGRYAEKVGEKLWQSFRILS